LTAIRLK